MNVREDKIDASVNLVRGFLLRVKKKTKNKKKNEMLNLWIDLENFKVLFSFSETPGNLAFYVTALSRHVHLIFLSICL